MNRRPIAVITGGKVAKISLVVSALVGELKVPTEAHGATFAGHFSQNLQTPLAALDLADTNQLLASLAENLPGMIHVLEVSGQGSKSVYASNGAYALYERTPDEIVSGDLLLVKMLPPEAQRDFMALLRRHVENLQGGSWVGEFFLPSGQRKFIQINFQPIKLENGRVRFLAFHFDITQARNQELELAHSKDRLQVAVRAMHLGVWDWDIRHDRLIWDDSMYELFGLKREGFGGDYQAFEKILLPEDAPRVAAELQEAFKRRADYSSEFRIRRNDGQIRVIRAESKGLYDHHGDVLRHIGVNWDITDQREKEIRLLQSSKMSTLGEMSAGIAHEINNPLAIIGGKAQQIQLMVKRGIQDTNLMLEYLETINRTVKRIADIIRGLRAFARDAGQDPFASVDVMTLVNETLDLCRSRFTHQQIQLSVEGLVPGLALDCRASQISQVLLNLLNNAFDAVLPLDERWVRLEVIAAGEHLHFVVTDSGKGIAAAISDKIMQPFFTTKQVGKGTGLGLSIATGIVQSHGGQIHIDSSSPNTRFIVVLPWRQAGVRPAGSQREAA